MSTFCCNEYLGLKKDRVSVIITGQSTGFSESN